MRIVGRVLLGCAAAMTAAAAAAETVVYPAREAPTAAYTLVPPDQRLTALRVFGDAAPEVKLVMALLILGTLAALAVWALSLGKVGTADAKGVAGALGRLRIVRSAGVPLGCLGAGYVMFSSFLAISNVRPAPGLTIVAPGLAEASLVIVLGLLATTVAVICERHLEARIRRAAA